MKSGLLEKEIFPKQIDMITSSRDPQRVPLPAVGAAAGIVSSETECAKWTWLVCSSYPYK